MVLLSYGGGVQTKGEGKEHSLPSPHSPSPCAPIPLPIPCTVTTLVSKVTFLVSPSYGEGGGITKGEGKRHRFPSPCITHSPPNAAPPPQLCTVCDHLITFSVSLEQRPKKSQRKMCNLFGLDFELKSHTKNCLSRPLIFTVDQKGLASSDVSFHDH